MSSQSEDPEVVKNRITELCKTSLDISISKDVLMTKTNRVILRMSNRGETGVIRDKIMEDEALTNLIKVNIPRKRRERMLILSVDPSVREDLVKEAIKRIVEESTHVSRMAKEVSRKLQSSTLDENARETLQDLYTETALDFSVIRRIKNRNGRMNWLIDIDGNDRDVLLSHKIICLDFERYRVVDFISVTRCFKCQSFGNYADQCKGETHCAKCAEDRSMKNCKSGTVCCHNCYFQVKNGEYSYYADSTKCPANQKFSLKTLPQHSQCRPF